MADILVHVDPTPQADGRLQIAVDIARRFDGRVVGLHVISPARILAVRRPGCMPDVVEAYLQGQRAGAAEARRRFDRALRGSGLPGEWRCREGTVASVLARHARLADLL